MPQKAQLQGSEFYTSVPAFVRSGMRHGFFGRRGGVSEGLYESLNCGVGSQDERPKVLENRRRVADAMGVAPDHLATVHQVHSSICVYTRAAWQTDARPQADAMVTDVPGLALAILASDCAPVLFYAGGEKPVIGAAHAGWTGALKGVLENTIAEMKKLDAGEISACIGPCIARGSYEVSEDFSEPFLEMDPEDERFFQAGRREGHLMFDLPGYCAARLARAGLRNVYIEGSDTYTDEAGYFSYRRATHRKEPDYGRQMSAIVISGT